MKSKILEKLVPFTTSKKWILTVLSQGSKASRIRLPMTKRGLISRLRPCLRTLRTNIIYSFGKKIKLRKIKFKLQPQLSRQINLELKSLKKFGKKLTKTLRIFSEPFYKGPQPSLLLQVKISPKALISKLVSMGTK